MTNREIDLLLWGACVLGARITAIGRGRDLSTTEIGDLGRLVGQIADGESTVGDPTERAALDPRIGELLHRLETLNVIRDRELARRIMDGFRASTAVDD